MKWNRIQKYLLYPFVPLFIVIQMVFARRKASYISSLCIDNSKILDVGCGDGSIAEMIMELNPSIRIVGVEVKKIKKSKIPHRVYDGRYIPYPASCFEIVMIIDVLHHLTDMYALLEEAKRVTKRYIIIKDHIASSILDRVLLAIPDYVAHLFIDVSRRGNYLCWEEWEGIFRRLKLREERRIEKFSLGFGMNEKRNFIVRLEV